MKQLEFIYGLAKSGKTQLMWEKLLSHTETASPRQVRLAVISDETAIVDDNMTIDSPYLYSAVAFSNDKAEKLIEALEYEKNRREMYTNKAGYTYDFVGFRKSVSDDEAKRFSDIVVGVDNFDKLSQSLKDRVLALTDLPNDSYKNYGMKFVVTSSSLSGTSDIDFYEPETMHFLRLGKADNNVIREKKFSYYTRDNLAFGEYHTYAKNGTNIHRSEKTKVASIHVLNETLLSRSATFYGQKPTLDNRYLDYSQSVNAIADVYNITFFESLYQDIKSIMTTNELVTMKILSKSKAYRVFNNSKDIPEAMRNHLSIPEIMKITIAVQVKKHKTEKKEVDKFLELGFVDTVTIDELYPNIEKIIKNN